MIKMCFLYLRYLQLSISIVAIMEGIDFGKEKRKMNVKKN